MLVVENLSVHLPLPRGVVDGYKPNASGPNWIGRKPIRATNEQIFNLRFIQYKIFELWLSMTGL